MTIEGKGMAQGMLWQWRVRT